MNDLLDEAHARVALDLLEADPGLTVYENVVPAGTTPPYVLAYVSVEWVKGNDSDALDGRARTCWTRWYLHFVGATQAAARAAAGRGRGLLLNVRPTITGRTCGLIEQEAAPPPTRDESTGTARFDVAAVYRLRTED